MRNKRKGILMASAILGSAAIVSTGFAAWVISTPTTASVEGNIEVDTVTDNRVSMTANWDSGAAWNVSFGAPANASTGWLTNVTKQGETPVLESLTNKLNIDLAWSNPDRTDNLNGVITVDFKVDGEDASEFESNYIKVPALAAELTVTNGEVDPLEVKFGWGAAFGDKGGDAKNPYTYFNSKTDPNAKPTSSEHIFGNGQDTWADIAYDSLVELEKLKTLTYSITLTFTLSD